MKSPGIALVNYGIGMYACRDREAKPLVGSIVACCAPPWPRFTSHGRVNSQPEYGASDPMPVSKCPSTALAMNFRETSICVRVVFQGFESGANISRTFPWINTFVDTDPRISVAGMDADQAPALEFAV